MGCGILERALGAYYDTDASFHYHVVCNKSGHEEMMDYRPVTDKALLGRFWLEGCEVDASRSGLLVLEEDGASLQVEGSLSESRVIKDAVIFGTLTDHSQAVTLFNCFGGVTYQGGKAIRSQIESTLLVFGRLTKQLDGEGIEFRLNGSETWFYEQTFNVEADSTTGDVTVRFRAHEERHYKINESLTLVKVYRSTVPFGMRGVERFEATRTLVFRLVSKYQVPYDELWESMVKFRRFLEFFSQHPLEQSDVGILETRKGVENLSVFPVHYSTLFPITKRKFEWDALLIRYDEVEDRFEYLLARWFSIYEQQPEPFDRFFSAFERGHFDAVLHFLWIIAAVEELHKARTTRKQPPDLIDRLKDLRARWSAAMESPLPDEVLVEIKDSRHYYAHAAGDLRTKAARDWRLLRYSHFLASIFHLEVLSLLGYSDDEISFIARDRYWIRESLALRMFPD